MTQNTTMTIKSKGKYYYCWAEIEDGRVVALGDEDGRSGGIYWRYNRDGDLIGAIEVDAFENPNWYRRVRKAAPKSNLPSLKKIERQVATRLIRRERDTLKRAMKEVNDAKRRIKELGRRIPNDA